MPRPAPTLHTGHLTLRRSATPDAIFALQSDPRALGYREAPSLGKKNDDG